jgi:hypothetical protein
VNGTYHLVQIPDDARRPSKEQIERQRNYNDSANNSDKKKIYATVVCAMYGGKPAANINNDSVVNNSLVEFDYSKLAQMLDKNVAYFKFKNHKPMKVIIIKQKVKIKIIAVHIQIVLVTNISKASSQFQHKFFDMLY